MVKTKVFTTNLEISPSNMVKTKVFTTNLEISPSNMVKTKVFTTNLEISPSNMVKTKVFTTNLEISPSNMVKTKVFTTNLEIISPSNMVKTKVFTTNLEISPSNMVKTKVFTTNLEERSLYPLGMEHAIACTALSSRLGLNIINTRLSERCLRSSTNTMSPPRSQASPGNVRLARGFSGCGQNPLIVHGISQSPDPLTPGSPLTPLKRYCYGSDPIDILAIEILVECDRG
ncbi:MAG: hypothetical protein GDA56_13680 [Hormoscilla sp. GM7CHS1pb]|nr:hypothetical protein [Hormoscilla sp. GM7CHS1pb]